MTLAKAIRIATIKHGQSVDKGGQPFIGHPLRVMASMAAQYADAPEWVLAAAVMHDVLEDTGTDYRELIHEAGDYRAVYLTMILTRDDEQEGYFDYVARVKQGMIKEPEGDLLLPPEGDPSQMATWAVRIKLCDLADNLNPQRRVPGMKLPERYERAVAMLKG